ncbi:MAG: ABC transporter permease [Verrucomicrobia subdivision 3 bacterium]|nr:ABC transporter permease [Opitutaceae bacterium]MCC6823965.1 ABC transporter permease [Limisphaerales bacterium]
MNFLTELREGLSISFAAIRANKMRAALTTLGIVIGIVTVTLMGTAIEGLNRSFMQSVSTLGADVLYVDRQNWVNHSHAEWLAMMKRRELSIDQCRALEKQATFAVAVAPITSHQYPVKFKNRRSDSVEVLGTTEAYQATSGIGLAQGRFITAAEAEGGRPVCVIGTDVATNLFLHETPLGKPIAVGPRTFEVVGVMEKQGSLFGAFSLDNRVIIPLRQFTTWFWSNPSLTIAVKVSNVAQLEDQREELRHVMRRIRHIAPGQPDDFSINQQDQIVAMFHRVAGTIAAIGLFITGLSLFVGGIGIMNIMFVSVAERTREIGIRKAIGAKRRTILLQFLIEAASICLLGGLIGLAIAWPVTFVIQKFLPATMSFSVMGIALLVSLVTGVLSGFFPAWRAARMNPVDALRAE